MLKEKKCLLGREGQSGDYTGKFCSRVCKEPDRSAYDMQVVNNFISYLNGFLSFGDDFRRSILPMLCVRTFRKKERIVMEGEVCTSAFWLHAGYARCFVETKDADGLPFEKTVKFYGQGKIAAINSCFFGEHPSVYSLELSAGSVIIPFSKCCFDLLKFNAPETENLANNIMAMDGLESLEKMELKRLDPRKRYQEFLRIFGLEIEQYFAIKHIASYLSIRPSFLSRIRREYYKK